MPTNAFRSQDWANYIDMNSKFRFDQIKRMAAPRIIRSSAMDNIE